MSSVVQLRPPHFLQDMLPFEASAPGGAHAVGTLYLKSRPAFAQMLSGAGLRLRRPTQ